MHLIILSFLQPFMKLAKIYLKNLRTSKVKAYNLSSVSINPQFTKASNTKYRIPLRYFLETFNPNK